MIYGPYPPLAAEHPLVTGAAGCPECAATFVAGDVVGLQPMEGQALGSNVECLPVHWSCVAPDVPRERGWPSPAVLPSELLRGGSEKDVS